MEMEAEVKGSDCATGATLEILLRNARPDEFAWKFAVEARRTPRERINSVRLMSAEDGERNLAEGAIERVARPRSIRRSSRCTLATIEFGAGTLKSNVRALT